MSEWVLILAAGESRRFNGIKALAAWKGGTLLSHAVSTAQNACPHIMVVTGAYSDQITPALLHVNHTFNANWSDGMGRSLATGVQAIINHDPTATLITLLPVDQPFAASDYLTVLADTARTSGQCVLTSSDNAIGPPASIPSSFFPDLMQLTGDKGLKSILRSDQYQTIHNSTALCDIDTQDDWHNYQ